MAVVTHVDLYDALAVLSIFTRIKDALAAFTLVYFARSLPLSIGPILGEGYRARQTQMVITMLSNSPGASSGDSTQLLYLRARQYAPSMSRFLTKDIWEGIANIPITFNHWLYANGNPIRYIDPTGNYTEADIEKTFGVELAYDLQYRVDSTLGSSDKRNDWYIGTPSEITQRFDELYDGLSQFANALGGLQNWQSDMLSGGKPTIYYVAQSTRTGGRTWPDKIVFYSLNLSDSEQYVIHEVAHMWGFRVIIDGVQLVEYYRRALGAGYISRVDGKCYCSPQYDKNGQRIDDYNPTLRDRGLFADPQHPDIGPDSPIINQNLSNHYEDLAISVTRTLAGGMPKASFRLYWIALHMPGIQAKYGITYYQLLSFQQDYIPGWLLFPCIP